VTSKFAIGLNPRQNFILGHGDNSYVVIKNMCNNRIYPNKICDKVKNETFIKINNRSNLQSGNLLFSGIGTIGRVYLLDEMPTNRNISESVLTMLVNERVRSEFFYAIDCR
jgi:type I restriction enzyme S subunit